MAQADHVGDAPALEEELESGDYCIDSAMIHDHAGLIDAIGVPDGRIEVGAAIYATPELQPQSSVPRNDAVGG
jgi:hypothetical protein